MNEGHSPPQPWTCVCCLFLTHYLFLAFLALLIVQLKDSDRKQRGGVTNSKGTRAGSQTRVRCRASAHGTRMLPTELSSAPSFIFFYKRMLVGEPEHPEKTRMKTQGAMSHTDGCGGPTVQFYTLFFVYFFKRECDWVNRSTRRKPV